MKDAYVGARPSYEHTYCQYVKLNNKTITLIPTHTCEQTRLAFRIIVYNMCLTCACVVRVLCTYRVKHVQGVAHHGF
jgi:hypothetical protein